VVTEQLKQITSKKYRLAILEKGARALAAFSLTERLVFFALALVFAVSTFILVVDLSRELTVPVPAQGGSVTEGIIGIPRFINPLLAISDADRDITTLVYSGLMKVADDGALVPDLAERVDISPKGDSYTFYLRPDARFHDAKPITADDIVFTIKKAQDPNLKSPKRASWEGVTPEKIDERTVRLTLKQPYPPFLENATLGILPMHIWGNVDTEQFTFSQYNIEPIGSGPYRIKSIKRSGGGIPLSYTLVPFKDYVLGEAYIQAITLKFYPSEESLIDGYEKREVQSLNSISPHSALALSALGNHVVSVPLPRVFAVFFNQNDVPAFTQSEVRKVLSTAIDRKRIVDEVLYGYGVPITGPLPETLFGKLASSTEDSDLDWDTVASTSRKLLERNGWKPANADGVLEKTVKKEKVRLEFSIATANTLELKAAAKIIKENWESLGAKVTLAFFDASDLNQNVIRPREYDALFFGEIVGRDLDLFAFWHSSQRNDPGLNIALYTNIKTDKLLESARGLSSREARIEKYKEFATELEHDAPAAFVYSPDFIYIVPSELQGIDLRAVTIPSDRFLNSNRWYVETDRVWKWFTSSVESRVAPSAQG